MKVCSQCLRVVRKQARLEQLVGQNGGFHTRSQGHVWQLRGLTTTSISRQHSQTQTQTQNPQQPPPAPMPSTASTVTTNIAADIPPDTPSASEPSTATMQQALSHNLKPEPLVTKFAKSFRSVAKGTTETYVVYGLTETLFKSCSAQADYTIPEDQRMGIYTGQGPPKNAGEEDLGLPVTKKTGAAEDTNSWWFDTMGLEPTFSTWSQVTFLHMYIITVKMRALSTEKQYLEYQRYFSEHFSAAAEDKMIILHNMNAKSIRSKYLKDLFMQWRGILYAYDEGLVKGDAVLGSAIWRNLWKAEEEVDWEKVAAIVRYMRRTIASLDRVSIEEIGSGLKRGGFWESAQQL